MRIDLRASTHREAPYCHNVRANRASRLKPAIRNFLPWAICRNVLEDFCCINFGGFCRGFSWRIFLGTFSHKNEEKKSGEKIREKIRRLKNKNRKKSILPKAGPKIFSAPKRDSPKRGSFRQPRDESRASGHLRNRAVTESFGKSEIPWLKHFCDLCRNPERQKLTN